jgi:hypothetical protein
MCRNAAATMRVICRLLRGCSAASTREALETIIREGDGFSHLAKRRMIWASLPVWSKMSSPKRALR